MHKAFLWFRLKRTKRSPLSHPSSPIVAHLGRAAHDNWETSQCGCTCADRRLDWSVGLYSMKTGTCRSNTDLSLFSLKDHLCKRRDFNHSGTPRIPGCIGGWDGLEEENYENTLWFFYQLTNFWERFWYFSCKWSTHNVGLEFGVRCSTRGDWQEKRLRMGDMRHAVIIFHKQCI